MTADMAAGKEAGTPQSRPPSMFGMLGGKSSKVGGWARAAERRDFTY